MAINPRFLAISEVSGDIFRHISSFMVEMKSAMVIQSRNLLQNELTHQKLGKIKWKTANIP